MSQQHGEGLVVMLFLDRGVFEHCKEMSESCRQKYLSY